MQGPSSVFDESVVCREKNGKNTSQKESEKSSSGTKQAEKGQKRIFKSQSRQPRITKSATIAIDRSHFVSQNV